MDDKAQSIWKRPWAGWRQILAWFALLVGGIFVVVCVITLAISRSALTWEFIPGALLISIVFALVGVSVFFFIRWLCHWKNLRKVLFGVACFATLLALVVTEENWRGKHAWQKHRREWEAKGEKFTIAELMPPKVPDEKNFALTPLLRPILEITNGPGGTVWRDTNAMARLEKLSAELLPQRQTNDHLVLGRLDQGTFADVAACAEFYRGNTNYPQAVTGAAPADQMLTALGKFDPEIKELHEAAVNRTFSRFPIQYGHEPGWEILLPHLANIKRFTTLTQVRALAELEAGRPAEAFEDLKLGLRLSDSIRCEPLLIDHLVRIACLGINLQTVREGLVRHAWTEAQLVELEKALGSMDLLAEYKLAMRGERALSTGGLDYLRRGGPRAREMLGMANAGAFSLMPSGFFYQNMLTISRMQQDYNLASVDERAHLVFPEISAKEKSVLEETRWGPYTVFAKMLMPALEKAVLRSAQMQTYVDAACIGCALERYRMMNGRLPETLGPLAPQFIDKIPNDVMDGKPLRYRLDSKGGYLLYSIGWNEKDDGGQLAWTKAKKERRVAVTDGDWVWLMSADPSSSEALRRTGG